MRSPAGSSAGGFVAAAFAHLHAKSGFSYGFGTAIPEEMVRAAADLGYRSLALTDQGGLYGVPRFLRACSQVGLSPVVGAELSVEAFAGIRGHVVLLAEGPVGYRSLSRLITAYRTSSEDRRNPSCPLPILLEHGRAGRAGLICLTGAIPFGLLPHMVLSPGPGDDRTPARAEGLLASLREAFGEEGLYAELTDDRTAGSRGRMRRVEELSLRAGVPALAAGEVAYLRPRDHRLHEILAAASNLSPLPPPAYRPTDRLHLASPDEILGLFADRRRALENAAAVTDRCAGTVALDGELHLPSANAPANGDEQGKRLLALALEGARTRYRANRQVDPSRLKARLRREISCINSLGMAGYFLIAREAVQIARQKGVPATGRGSAANSLVAHCLGLTQPEPFANRLLFERFVHEDRADPPDVDLDLCSRRRDEVRDELMRRYAPVGAAVAATANTLSLRGAVRIAARALGHPPAETDALARHVPRSIPDSHSWREILAEPPMRGHPLQDGRRHRLLMRLSLELSGRLWQAGTHLGGIVFGTRAHHLSDLVPLEPSGKPGLLRCQYDKDDLEHVGLPKLDLLGLRMHTALSEAGELVSKRLGKRFDPLSPPPDDKQTYALIRTGQNAGVFQLESPGQMHLSRRLEPRRFSDLVAQISLFRPGPVRGDLVSPYVARRHGREPYSVPLPELDPILRPTFGILLFQEQVLAVANAVAGFSLVEGDLLRRAMTKDRGPAAMRELRGEFMRRARARGVPPNEAAEVFTWMEGFSVYGFSAAHAASFAELSYASAYLRCHHPAEFFCGLLNAQPMGFYSPRVLLNEARRAGLSVFPPDVHLSAEGCSVEEGGGALRVGLRYCRGLSHAGLRSLLSERGRRPFASLSDLHRRTDVDRSALQNLIRSGALDDLPNAHRRREELRTALLLDADRLPAKPRRNPHRHPELDFPHPADPRETREDPFASQDVVVAATSLFPLGRSDLRILRWEWASLGLNVSRHPLHVYRKALAELRILTSTAIRRLPHGTQARAAGFLETLQSPPTKSGCPVWFVLIEDEAGLLQATIFRRVYERYGHLLHNLSALLLEGTVEQDPRRGFSFVVERLEDLGPVLDASRAELAPSPARGRGATHGSWQAS